MAVLHRKEEKIQAVLGRLPKKYNPDDFVAMFIKLYSKDWGKIKSAYIKASQDKEPGTVIHMPKPELYLKQVLEIFLTQHQNPVVENAKEEVKESIPPVTKVTKEKAPAKKAEKKEPGTIAKKPKAAVSEEVTPKVAKSKVIEAVEPKKVVRKKKVL
ncbi:MAG: hypothetical protein ACQUHE_05470 [Bacteroidia bacterium]